MKLKMSYKPPPSTTKAFNIFLILFSLTLIFLTIIYHEKLQETCVTQFQIESQQMTFPRHITKPRWYEFVAKKLNNQRMKIGIVHTNDYYNESTIYEDAETVDIHFKRVAKNIQWSDLFPLWIEESLPRDSQPCPEIPMPRFDEYDDLDLIVARDPCGSEVENRTFEDVIRLQINLVVADLLVRNGLKNLESDPPVYVVFIGSCSPMRELFRCEDLLWHEENFWIYKPDLRRLKQKLLLPMGSCQLAPPIAKPG